MKLLGLGFPELSLILFPIIIGIISFIVLRRENKKRAEKGWTPAAIVAIVFFIISLLAILAFIAFLVVAFFAFQSMQGTYFK